MSMVVAYRECPQCKEEMRRDAHICPKCRSESEAWRFHGAAARAERHLRELQTVIERGLAELSDGGIIS